MVIKKIIVKFLKWPAFDWILAVKQRGRFVLLSFPDGASALKQYMTLYITL